VHGVKACTPKTICNDEQVSSAEMPTKKQFMQLLRPEWLKKSKRTPLLLLLLSSVLQRHV